MMGVRVGAFTAVGKFAGKLIEKAGVAKTLDEVERVVAKPAG
jgi:hypothetical protein